MSQQGGRPTGHEDDWWGQLYDDSTADTGPAPTADSLDDRFASASGAVRPAGTAGERGDSGDARDTGGGGDGGDGGDTVVSIPEPRSESGGPGDWWRAESGTATPPVPPPVAPTSVVPPPVTPPPVTPPPVAPAPAVPPPVVPAPRDRTGRGAGSGNWNGPVTGGPWEPPAPLPPGFAGHGTPTPPAAPAPPTTPAPPSAPPRPPAEPPSHPPTAVDLPTTPPPPGHAPEHTPERAPETTPDTPLTRPPAYVGSGPPTYDAEPTALPAADPDDLDDLVPDTVLDGARYGACVLRAASVRGDSARYRGEPRRDSLLTARFGTGDRALVLVAMATGARATPGAHRAAAEACRWIARAVGRSHVRLAEDIRAARRGDLKSGLHRLTDRSLGKLRAGAAEQGLEPEAYAATLRCLLLPADPDCRVRVFFGVGAGGLFRLRDGAWRDIEPQVGETAGGPVVGLGAPPAETPEGDRLTMDLGVTTAPDPYGQPPEPPREPFRFRASVARPGDTLLMCTGGLAEPLRGEPELSAHLTGRWSDPTPPGLAAFLADTQVRVKGYADDRTAAAVWEA
ncbi:protein phosphatase 2C domain-containing protein [Streptomyces sp. Amel2xC10]|uniref:protein phosphatase 2C domain-containing protein n=1 Tax=Streptomyces sp. Amel2xC10 TaxID=1305826 RepID=UPI000A08552D|nr:protein phosphatase 2C domain-containing protein [Streptomyces sp. Amel2xC10]SMF39133.1 Protein phosphatase 2C [Streptomyces sp. Amel2xC10]